MEFLKFSLCTFSIEEALQKILDCGEEKSDDDSIFEAEEDCMVADSLLAVESFIGQDTSC